MASLIAYCRLINKKGVAIAVQTVEKRTIVPILAIKSKQNAIINMPTCINIDLTLWTKVQNINLKNRSFLQL